MLAFLDGLVKQVTQHSTVAGQLWYALTFVFRLFISTTIAGEIYGDDLGAFDCPVTADSDKVGCKFMCYDQYAEVNHLRFWQLQILAVTIPTVFFHFYVTYITDQIKKIERVDKLIKEQLDDVDSVPVDAKTLRQHSRRKAQIGTFKTKTFFRNGEEVNIYTSKKIFFGILINLFVRLTMEVVLIYYSAVLFSFKNDRKTYDFSLKDFFTVPFIDRFVCVQSEHTNGPCNIGTGYAPSVNCHLSRVPEKRLVMRIMNITSIVCMVVTIVEIALVIRRASQHHKDVIDPMKEQLTMRDFGTEMKYRQSPMTIGASVRESVRGTVRGSVNGTVRGSVNEAARKSANGAVRKSANGTVRGTVRQSVRDGEDNSSFQNPGCSETTAPYSVSGSVRGSVRGSVSGSVMAGLDEQHKSRRASVGRRANKSRGRSQNKSVAKRPNTDQ